MNKEFLVNMPPSRICSVCRNRMGEICMEECAIKKDYKYFEPDGERPIDTLPALSMKEYRELTGKAKGEWIFYLQGRILAFIGGNDGSNINYPPSRRILANIKKQSLLAGTAERDSPLKTGEKCPDKVERP